MDIQRGIHTIMDLVNFLGPTYQAASPTQDAQEAINWYMEIDPTKAQGERGRFSMYPAPGRTLVWSPNPLYSGVGRALWTLPGNNNFLFVVGQWIYLLGILNSQVVTISPQNPGVPANYGSPLATSSGPMSITDNGVEIFLADGVNRYLYAPAGFSGSISGTILAVTFVGYGTIVPNAALYNAAGVNVGFVLSYGLGGTTGTGGTGTYTVGFPIFTYAQNMTSVLTTTLTDGPFAASVGAVQADVVDCIDSYVVYNQPNTAEWGATNLLSSVSNPLSFASKVVFSDQIVTLICDHNTVWLLGEKTSEPWVWFGGFPFPFQLLQGGMMQHGCAAKKSVARLGESFAFIAKDDRGIAVVVQMVGYIPQRISTHALETAMQKYQQAGIPISDAIAYTYQQAGHEFYVLTFPTADVTWVYDLATEMWHKRATRDNANNYHRVPDNCACTFQGKTFTGDYSNGTLYLVDQTNYTMNGAVMPCKRTAQHLTQDLHRITYNDLQIQFQPGIGLQIGQGSNPQAMLQWSDDGGFTWSHEHWAAIGKVGKYKNRAIWRRMGIARDRVFSVTVTDPVYRTVVSAELNATPMNY